jgi:multidrug efflux system outer membrane protein
MPGSPCWRPRPAGPDRATLANQQEALRLTQAGLTAAMPPRWRLRQAQTSVETARASLAQYTRQQAQDLNALNLLTGPRPCRPRTAALGAARRRPGGRGAGRDGFLHPGPAPDVLAAEHNLLAANANIGAARAAFFPSITLTGQRGTASASFSRLFSAGRELELRAADQRADLLGRRSAGQPGLAKVQTQLQVAEYERTIQTAFREVADVLAARGTYDTQIPRRRRWPMPMPTPTGSRCCASAAGLDTYQAPLDSQRQLYTAQQELISLRCSGCRPWSRFTKRWAADGRRRRRSRQDRRMPDAKAGGVRRWEPFIAFGHHGTEGRHLRSRRRHPDPTRPACPEIPERGARR